MRCVNPIHIRRENSLTGVEEYDVPCGKCAPCLRRKQSEFACLAVLESMKASSIHFLTLTYNNRTAPIAVSLCGDDSSRKFRFLDDSERPEIIPLLLGKDDSLVDTVIGDYEYCPSLRREDVRLFLKRCRVAWFRLGKLPLPWKYAAFGEYGTGTLRPHYHLEIINASDEFVNFLVSRWNSEFGFSDLRKVRRVNADGSNGFLRVSLYISKYIAKPKSVFPFLLDGVAEMPRRFSSRHFGTDTISVHRLKDYYLCKDLDLPKNDLALRIADRSRYITLEGLKFPLPRALRLQIYYRKSYESKYDPVQGKEIVVPVYKRTALSKLALEASRSRDLESFGTELRENSEANPDLSFRQVCCIAQFKQDASALAGEEIASKNILLNMKKEKV